MTDGTTDGDEDARLRSRAERVAMRRRLLAVDRSGRRDNIDAAAECECACHPQPGADLHQRGPCLCQLTDEERRARWREAEGALAGTRKAYAKLRARHSRDLAAAAAELDVEAMEESPGAPWVIRGTVDGRRFTMRERWDNYTITVDSLQPSADSSRGDVVVLAAGDSRDLSPRGSLDYRQALRFIVGVVRTATRRSRCPHDASRGSRFCANCGQALADPALPDAAT